MAWKPKGDRRNERNSRHLGFDRDARHSGEQARDARIRRWRADGGDGRTAVRPSRLPPRGGGVPWCVAGRIARGRTPRVPLDRSRGQLLRVLPGADGFGVGVPDRELRHGLLLGVPRLVRRTDGDRRAVDRVAVRGSRDDRRHVVPVGHGLRPARSGPRPGRSLSPGGARLRRAASRQRLPRLARSNDARNRDRPGVHDRQRSEDRSRSDPDRLSCLSLRSGCTRDCGRHVSRR